MNSVPSGASYNREIRFTKVDFPDPVGPTMARLEPAGTVSDTLLSTGVSP